MMIVVSSICLSICPVLSTSPFWAVARILYSVNDGVHRIYKEGIMKIIGVETEHREYREIQERHTIENRFF